MTTSVAARDESEATGPAPARTHFAGFELIRAMSSILIVVHHAGALAGVANTGRAHQVVEVLDVGVAVFFVTSGFLIYRPLVAAHLSDRPPPTLRSFWWRRLLRVVPAYWAALTFFWVLGNFRLGDAWWRFYLFVQIYDPLTVLGGLVQAWTLATEVAFYLLVPLWALAVGSVVRRFEGRTARLAVELGACALLWAVAIVSRWAVPHVAPSKLGVAFTWLPMNLDTFAWGMAFATLSVEAAHRPGWKATLDRIGGRVWVWWLAASVPFFWYAYVVGASGAYVGWFWQRRQLTYLLIAILVVVPVVFGDQDRGRIRRAWSWPVVIWLGTVSYGLYLWHFDWMKRAVQGYDFFYQEETWQGWLGTPAGNSSFVALLVIGFACGLLFAAASWYLLERPLQRLKHLVGSVPRPPRATRGAEAAPHAARPPGRRQ